MRIRILTVMNFVLLAGVNVFAKDDKDHGYIPDSQTAVNIGRTKLIHIYGKKQIDSEEPLKAELQDGVWVVSGTLWCSDGKGGRTNECVGGVAVIKMRQSDGHVVSIMHYK